MNKFNILAVSIIIAALSLTGCGGDDSSNAKINPDIGTPNDGTLDDTVDSKGISLEGQVTNNSGNPLAGATIKVGDKTLTTDNNGGYSIILDADDDNDNIVVLVKKAGYLTTAREIAAIKEGAYKLDIQLSADQVTTAFVASTGIDNLPVSGAKVTIPANSVVDADGNPYSGSVNIAANYYNPDSIEGAQAFAQPFAGQNADGSNETSLVTVGVIDVKLTNPSTGAELDLKDGAKATLEFPEASTDQDLEAIPLWYYDEDKLIWVKDGVATRQADGSYTGKVSHFTLWNLDIPVGLYPALVEGCFIDHKTKKRRTAGVFATIKGRGFKNSGSIDAKGNFSVQVPMNTPLTLVPAFDNNSFNAIEIPALAQNAVYKINDGNCIEATKTSYDSFFTITNEFTSSLPAAPIVVTPNPEPTTPEVPFKLPLEQNKEGIIGYAFEIDTDSDSKLENVYFNTFRALTDSVAYYLESLYTTVNYENMVAEGVSEDYMLTRQGLSQHNSISVIEDNKIKFEILKTSVRGNQLINNLDNGFRGVLTLNDKSLSGLKIGNVLSYNIDVEDFPNSIVTTLNNLPFSKGIFSGNASCKVIRSVQSNIDHIMLSGSGYEGDFDKEASLLDINPIKGTWAGIPWATGREADDDGTYEAIVKSSGLIYSGEYTKSGFENLSVEEQNTCAYYNEAAKNQILEALRTAYPTL